MRRYYLFTKHEPPDDILAMLLALESAKKTGLIVRSLDIYADCPTGDTTLNSDTGGWGGTLPYQLEYCYMTQNSDDWGILHNDLNVLHGTLLDLLGKKSIDIDSVYAKGFLSKKYSKILERYLDKEGYSRSYHYNPADMKTSACELCYYFYTSWLISSMDDAHFYDSRVGSKDSKRCWSRALDYLQKLSLIPWS